MSSDLPRSPHDKMGGRTALAQEFFAVTKPELIPFVSDEATWFDFDYLEPDQLSQIVKAHYGIDLDQSILARPFWEFLDYLNKTRK